MFDLRRKLKTMILLAGSMLMDLLFLGLYIGLSVAAHHLFHYLSEEEALTRWVITTLEAFFNILTFGFLVWFAGLEWVRALIVAWKTTWGKDRPASQLSPRVKEAGDG